MNMQVREFLDMFTFPDDQRFRLYDNDKDEIIFNGCLTDIPEDKEYLEYAEITSIDNIYNNDPLTLNVDVDEEVMEY